MQMIILSVLIYQTWQFNKDIENAVILLMVCFVITNACCFYCVIL